MDFRKWLTRKVKKKPDKLLTVVEQEEPKNWRRVLYKQKYLTNWLSFWTKKGGYKDFIYLTCAAVLVLSVAFVWYNIGVNLAERKLLQEKQSEIQKQIALEQEKEKAGKNHESQALSLAKERTDKNWSAAAGSGGKQETAAAVPDKQETVSEQPRDEDGDLPESEPDETPLAVAKPSAAEKLSWLLPVKGKVEARFGEWYVHPVFQDWRYESGMDFAVEAGEPVKAMADGIIKGITPQRGLGKIVTVDHGGVLAEYRYCFDVGVKVGQEVKQGDQLGIAESLGKTEPFVHIEIIKDGIPVNPGLYLKGN